MLSNIEFAAITNTRIDLPPAIAELALFTVDLGAVLGQEVDTKGVPLFPELSGRGKYLWKIHNGGKRRLRLMRKFRQNAEARENERIRQENLRKYVDRGWAFDPSAKSTMREPT